MAFIEINGRILDFDKYKKEVAVLRYELFYDLKECFSKYGFALESKKTCGLKLVAAFKRPDLALKASLRWETYLMESFPHIVMKEITSEKLEKYFSVTSAALKKIVISQNPEKKLIADDFLDMAQRYFSDAQHFRDKGDYVNAFGAVNYAHAWLDAGARLGVFEVHDSDLFAAD